MDFIKDTWQIFLLFACALGMIFFLMNSSYEKSEKARNDFLKSMKLSNCKRTGYAGRDAIAVWTCPDGTVFLQP